MTPPLSSIETKLRQQGFALIAGVDEAGRGPLAGPVVAAAVILPARLKIKGLDDSKKLTPARRLELFEIIRDKATAVGVGIAEVALIDQVNILRASLFAMREAILGLDPLPHYVLVDGNKAVQIDIPQKTIIGGDAKVRSIAAASIIAKVLRDKLMLDYAKAHPGYGFEKHKGYGTKKHFAALEKLGPSPIHRMSWASVAQGKLI